MESWTSFFTDPILRAPTIGSMLMCLAAGLVGTIVFVRKQSLLGEALSHASYPGVILGALFAGFLALGDNHQLAIAFLILGGAFISSLLGMGVMSFLEKQLRVTSDAALCFVLSSFFSIGITLASHMQFSYTSLYRQVQMYLYGQAATMTDIHILIYGTLVCIVSLIILLFYKELQAIAFDPLFAKTLGIPTKRLEALLFLMIVTAIIIGIRSVGVILMSAMLIAPPIAARQLTHRFSTLFILAGIFGLISGFLGNYLSIQLSLLWDMKEGRVALPTGPMIVVSASLLCIAALLFAPEQGLISRLWRAFQFRSRCLKENILKTMWRLDAQKPLSLKQIAQYQNLSKWHLKWVLFQLKRHGWIEKDVNRSYQLTVDGQARAAKIVRLHRLWEVYLAHYLGVGAERVHRNAEEMEHIITPEIEEKLILLLGNPKQDPHQQPIPREERWNAL